MLQLHKQFKHVYIYDEHLQIYKNLHSSSL